MTPLTVVITPAEVIEHAVRLFGVSEDDLRGTQTWTPLVHYRQVTQYVIRKMCGYSYPAIARIFRRDHTTIIHAVGRVEDSQVLGRIADQLAFEVHAAEGGSFT